MPSRAHRIEIALIVGLVVALVWRMNDAASSPIAVHPQQELEDSRPLGLRLIGEACVQCHDLDLVFKQQKTSDEWQHTIVMMMWRGAQLLPGETEIIRDYLVSDYARNLRPSSAAAPGGVEVALADGDGKSLVEAACSGCHDLSPIVSETRSAAEWRRIVQEMVRLGVAFDDGEQERVIHYLSTSLGVTGR